MSSLAKGKKLPFLEKVSRFETDIQLLKLFFNYLKPEWRLISFSLIAIPFSLGATVLVPWIIIKIFDDYLSVNNSSNLILMLGFFATTIFVGYVSDSVYSFCLQKTGQKAIFSMKGELFSHTLNLPRSYFDQNPVGVILTRLTSDFEALGESLASGVLSMLIGVIKTVILFSLLFYLSWKLTLVIFAILLPVFIVFRLLRKKLRQHYNDSREFLSIAVSYLQECLNGIKLIQLYAAEKKVIQIYKSKNEKFFLAQTSSNFYDALLYSLIEGITSIALGLIIWQGMSQVLAGMLSVGILIAFINTLQKIFIPIREFTQQVAVIQRGLAALEHIDELFKEEPEKKLSYENETDEANKREWKKLEEKLKMFESLSFKNVIFRYKEDGPNVLKGVSFEINKGDSVAIVGTTGSGKSTIIKILTKVYSSYEGSILLNGIELSEIPGSLVKKLIAVMQQDNYLFNETIEFNISLGRDDINFEQVKQASEYVYAHSFISQLAEGYQFQIKENGMNLSTGQIQLISFARSLAGGSQMIALDEATSSIDSITENYIQKTIEKLLREKTVIAIAHRLSTIKNSDQILVLDQGTIIEQGNHQQLLKLDGTYAQLVNSLE